MFIYFKINVIVCPKINQTLNRPTDVIKREDDEVKGVIQKGEHMQLSAMLHYKKVNVEAISNSFIPHGAYLANQEVFSK